MVGPQKGWRRKESTVSEIVHWRRSINKEGLDNLWKELCETIVEGSFGEVQSRGDQDGCAHRTG